MKNRKRVVSLVLGLVLMAGGVLGPFTMGSVATGNENDAKNISASLDMLESSDVNLKTLEIKGHLTGELTEELTGSEIILTFRDIRYETDQTYKEEIKLKGALSVIKTPVSEGNEDQQGLDTTGDNAEAGGADNQYSQDQTGAGDDNQSQLESDEPGQDVGSEDQPEGGSDSEPAGQSEDENTGGTTGEDTNMLQNVITATFAAKITEADIKEAHKDITFKLTRIEIKKDDTETEIGKPSEEFRFKVVSTGLENSGDIGTGEEITPQITFSEVEFYNGNSTGVQQISQNEGTKINFSFKAASNVTNGGEITVTAALRRGSDKGDIIENIHLTKGVDSKYSGSVNVPKYISNGNDYFVVINATQGSLSNFNADLMLTVLSTSQENPAPVDLQLERILSSTGQISNDSAQVFREGSSVTYTVRSKNPDVIFTSKNIIATITKKDGSITGASLTLAKVSSGNYGNREYAVTFFAQAPLAADDIYTITTESISYSLKSGETGTIPAGSVSYKTETNKPYIAAGGLKASYTSSPQSNTQVSQSALIAGNVVNLEADLTNGTGVYSVAVDYVNTQGAAGKNFSITLKKDSSTGKYKGSYTITANNVGYTYGYRQATYKTSENASSLELKNNDSVSALSFTVGNHQHRYGTAYSYDDKTHWNNSTCNDEHPNQNFRGNEAAHTFRSSVTNSASQSTSGTMTYTCTVCGYRYNATIPQSGAVLSTTILDNLAKVANGSRVAIVYSNDYVVSTDVFNALKGTTKELELINENGVTWIFKGTDITGTTKPININAAISTIQSNTGVNATAIKRLVGIQPTIVIDFPENGELPGKATVRVPLNTAMLNSLGSRENIKVQYYNPALNRLENIATIARIPDGNYIEFSITHNSSYIITKEAVGANGDNNNNNSNNNSGGNTNNSGNNNSGGTTNNNTNNNESSGNKKPTTTTTTTTVIHKVSPKTWDGNYGLLWVGMFMVGVLLVISSLCMTKFEE